MIYKYLAKWNCNELNTALLTLTADKAHKSSRLLSRLHRSQIFIGLYSTNYGYMKKEKPKPNLVVWFGFFGGQ